MSVSYLCLKSKLELLGGLSSLQWGPQFIERNWDLAPSLNFVIPISLQPDGVNLCYFKPGLEMVLCLKISKAELSS